MADPALGVTRPYVSTNIRKGVAVDQHSWATPTRRWTRPSAKGATANTPAERQAAYSEIQKQLVEDAPIAWLVEPQQFAIISKQYADCIVSAIGVCESYRRAKKVA